MPGGADPSAVKCPENLCGVCAASPHRPVFYQNLAFRGLSFDAPVGQAFWLTRPRLSPTFLRWPGLESHVEGAVVLERFNGLIGTMPHFGGYRLARIALTGTPMLGRQEGSGGVACTRSGERHGAQRAAHRASDLVRVGGERCGAEPVKARDGECRLGSYDFPLRERILVLQTAGCLRCRNLSYTAATSLGGTTSMHLVIWLYSICTECVGRVL